MPGRVAVVYGTRPEAVKLLGLITLLGPRAHTVHSGQHYSPPLAVAFEEGIGLPAPATRLAVGGGPRGRQIGEATSVLTDLLDSLAPAAVVVQGDTNTTLAAALAANGLGLPLVHVEAGLRSRDRAMPEEHNRVVVDHLADLCCAPTETSRANLAAEGIVGDRVVVTGNTVVEAVQQLTPPAARVEGELAARGLERNGFVLATFHRPENVDSPAVLGAILAELAALAHRLPVVLPLHPRTAGQARSAGLDPLLEKLRIEEPAGYEAFLGLMSSCALVVSDSGGVQEEASVLKRPVIVVRRSTERPEVLGTFCELVEAGPRIGAVAAAWLDDLPARHAHLVGLATPYGDGLASQRTLEALDRLVEPAA